MNMAIIGETMKKKKKKVYCGNCVYNNYSHYCCHPEHFQIIESAMEKIKWFGDCLILNKNNNCKRYKETPKEITVEPPKKKRWWGW